MPVDIEPIIINRNEIEETDWHFFFFKAELHAHGQRARSYCCFAHGLLQAGCLMGITHHWTLHGGPVFWPVHWFCSHICGGNLPDVSPRGNGHSASAGRCHRHPLGTGKLLRPQTTTVFAAIAFMGVDNILPYCNALAYGEAELQSLKCFSALHWNCNAHERNELTQAAIVVDQSAHDPFQILFFTFWCARLNQNVFTFFYWHIECFERLL